MGNTDKSVYVLINPLLKAKVKKISDSKGISLKKFTEYLLNLGLEKYKSDGGKINGI